MALHHRVWTAKPVVFECACGWQSNAEENESAAAEFDQHFRDIGYQFAAYEQPT